ncbi:hypothetical protein Tco_1158614, partial [Tanacetum coccineum]
KSIRRIHSPGYAVLIPVSNTLYSFNEYAVSIVLKNKEWITFRRLIRRTDTPYLLDGYGVLRFLALGWHLEEIHVAGAHLEKKRTRLRTYTKSLEESCSQSVETASQA